MTGFVLYKTTNIVNMNQFVLNMTGLVLNMNGFVPNRLDFEPTIFRFLSKYDWICPIYD